MRQELIELADTYRQVGDALHDAIMRKLLFTTTLALATALSAPDALSQHLRLLGMAPSGNPSFVIASPDGRYAFSVNEFGDGRQGVSSFALGENSIAPISSVPIPKEEVDGEDPCNFAISPDGRFLLCACRDDNRIEVYSINNLSGELTPTGKSIEVGSPVCIQFLEQ